MKGFLERLHLRYAYIKPLHKILDDKYYDNFMTAVQKAGYSSELPIKSPEMHKEDKNNRRQRDPVNMSSTFHAILCVYFSI